MQEHVFGLFYFQFELQLNICLFIRVFYEIDSNEKIVMQ